MRRLLVLLSLVGVGALASLSLPACGGNEKPPLTPDLIEPPVEATEAGADPAPAVSAPAAK